MLVYKIFVIGDDVCVRLFLLRRLRECLMMFVFVSDRLELVLEMNMLEMKLLLLVVLLLLFEWLLIKCLVFEFWDLLMFLGICVFGCLLWFFFMEIVLVFGIEIVFIFRFWVLKKFFF